MISNRRALSADLMFLFGNAVSPDGSNIAVNAEDLGVGEGRERDHQAQQIVARAENDGRHREGEDRHRKRYRSRLEGWSQRVGRTHLFPFGRDGRFNRAVHGRQSPYFDVFTSSNADMNSAMRNLEGTHGSG